MSRPSARDPLRRLVAVLGPAERLTTRNRAPPKVITFVLSLVPAVIVVVAVYGHLAVLRGINGFVILLIAYVVLAAGALIRGL